MRWTLPSWTAIVLGALLALLGMIMYFGIDATSGSTAAKWVALSPTMLLAGAILLGAGLLSLQSAWTAWCGNGGGCGCCGDDCECGDCGDCCEDDEHEGHGH